MKHLAVSLAFNTEISNSLQVFFMSICQQKKYFHAWRYSMRAKFCNFFLSVFSLKKIFHLKK
jgi:hypothetical protein